MDESESLEPEEQIERHLRQEYGELYDQLTEILYTHDPMRLAAHGAPHDEYSVELDAFLPHLKTIKSSEALSQCIYETFARMFSMTMNEQGRAQFDVIAEDIWHAYQQWREVQEDHSLQP